MLNLIRKIYPLNLKFFYLKKDFKYHKLKLAWNEAICTLFCKTNKIPLITFKELETFQNADYNIIIYDPLDFDILDTFNNMFPNKLTVLNLNNSFILDNISLNSIYNDIFKNETHKVFFEYVKNKLNFLKNIKSTDSQNRQSIKKLKDNIPIFPCFINNYTTICNNAIKFVNENYSDNPGNADNLIYLPICKKDAILYFRKFIKHRFYLYGKMQDAIHDDEILLFHSYLINVGFLTPKYIFNIIINISSDITPSVFS